MVLWKRGRRYWTQVMIDGVRIRRPLCPPGSTRATTKRQEAVQLEKDLIRAALEGKLETQRAPTRLLEACEKYLEAKEATANTKRAVEFDRERLAVVKRLLGAIKLSAITREVLEGFQANVDSREPATAPSIWTSERCGVS
jgi:hypothetical protein